MTLIPGVEDNFVVSLGIVFITLLLTIFTKRVLLLATIFTKKSKTKIDDILIEHIKFPLQILILTVGLYTAINVISIEIKFGLVSLNQIFSALWVLAIAYLVSRLVKGFFYLVH